MIQDCEDFMKKICDSQKIYGVEQSLLVIIPIVLVILTWISTRNWFAFPDFALCFVIAGTYKYFNYLLGLKYVSKYGRAIYENNFTKLWKGWYVLLVIFAVCITI